MPSKAEEKTGMGLVTEIRDATTKKGKPYFWVTIGGEEFSCWKPGLKKQLAVRSSVQFQYTEDEETEYKNIVSVEANGDKPSSGGGSGQPTKDKLIVRQTCIKVAGPLVGVNADTPAERAAEAIAIADLLEEWVWAKKPSEPEPPEEE